MHTCECAHQSPIELCVVRVSTLTFEPNTQTPTLCLLLKGAASWSSAVAALLSEAYPFVYQDGYKSIFSQ